MDVYVINLDRRTDRWEYVSNHLKEKEISFTRIPAIPTGWAGCRDTHISIMEGALRRKEDQFTILEDDVYILGDIWNWVDALEELPYDVDCLYWGASPKEPQERYSKHLYRLKHAHVTHAITWFYRPGGAIDYILMEKDNIRKIDDFFANVIQPQFNCFVMYPLFAAQKEGFKSDTCHNVDVLSIINNYNKYCI